MSGGHFNYDQYRIGGIADDIERLIESNEDKTLTEWGGRRGFHFRPDVIARFEEAVKALHIAEVYAQRIDWLVCGDDGEDTFIERLGEELERLR